MAQNNKDSGFNPNQKLKKYKVLILSLLLSSKKYTMCHNVGPIIIDKNLHEFGQLASTNGGPLSCLAQIPYSAEKNARAWPHSNPSLDTYLRKT